MLFSGAGKRSPERRKKVRGILPSRPRRSKHWKCLGEALAPPFGKRAREPALQALGI
jgi:hypothetical protein